LRQGYNVEALHIDSSWDLAPLKTPPPGFLADAKLRTPVLPFVSFGI